MSENTPPPPASDPAASSQPHPPRFFKTAKAEIAGGAALTVLLPVVMVLAATGQKLGQGGSRVWQGVGADLFLLLVPAVVIAIVVTKTPRSRRFGLGMLLGSGVLLLISTITCNLR